jgi:anti-anti-sigma regulatory factor
LRAAIYDLRLGAEEHKPFPELLEQFVEVHRSMAGNSEIELEIAAGIPTGSLGDAIPKLTRSCSAGPSRPDGVPQKTQRAAPTPRLGVPTGLDAAAQAKFDPARLWKATVRPITLQSEAVRTTEIALGVNNRASLALRLLGSYDADGALRLVLRGALDSAGAEELSTRLALLIDEGGRVRLNLSQLTLIDRTGIEALVGGVMDGRVGGGDLIGVDRNVGRPAREMIDLAGIGPVLWPTSTLSSHAQARWLAVLRRGQAAIRADCMRQRALAAEMRRTAALQRTSCRSTAAQIACAELEGLPVDPGGAADADRCAA